MPLFKCEAVIFTINERQAAQSINDFQVFEMRAALKAFLRACMPKIPVRTGFLRAAFKPLRQFAGGGQEGADLNPALAELFGANRGLSKERFNAAQTSDSRGKPLSESGREARIRQYQREMERNRKRMQKRGKGSRRIEWYYESNKRRVQKTPENARKYLFPKDPSESIKGNGLTTTIQFDIQIAYYRVNDFYGRIKGSPWRSMDAGFQAALNHLENAARRYPYLNEVLVTQRIFLRGTKVGKSSDSPNMAADYRRRFGSSFFPTAGNLIPEGSIGQSSDLGDSLGDDSGSFWMGNS